MGVRDATPVLTLVFYVSGHGFGHASRTIEVINAILARRPDLRITIRTTAARWLFERTVRGAFTLEPLECDTGLVQFDSLRMDVEASISRARAFMATFQDAVEREARAIRRLPAALVVSDIPALGVAAGARAGVPSVALGNFSWDWAYAPYAGTEDVVAAIAAAYAGATLALRLPMSGGFAAFPRVVDVPFVARHATHEPAETRRALGLPPDERLVLVSFGGCGIEGLDLDGLSRLDGYAVIVDGRTPVGPSHAPLAGIGRLGSLVPLDEAALYDRGFRYEDVIAAVDVVATKPGYGIVSECLANGAALLYTSRGEFAEYDVLVGEMPRFVRARFIGHDDLLAGRWASHLDALLAQPAPPERPPTDGAKAAADRLIGMLAV